MRRANNSHPGGAIAYGADTPPRCDRRSLPADRGLARVQCNSHWNRVKKSAAPFLDDAKQYVGVIHGALTTYFSCHFWLSAAYGAATVS
jgi:hypothetical protein